MGKRETAGLGLAQIAELLSPGGRPSGIDGYFFRKQVAACLQSALQLHRDIPPNERGALVRRVIAIVQQDGKVTEKAVSNAIEVAQREYLARPNQEWDVAASLHPPLPKSRVVRREAGVVLRFTRSWPEHVLESRKSPGIIVASEERLPKHATFVVGSVRARTPEEAVHRTGRAFAVLRGLWNLGLTYKQSPPSGGNRPRPIARVWSGKVETVHVRGNRDPVNTWWSDAGVSFPPERELSSREWKSAVQAERHFRRRRGKVAYRADLDVAMTRYTQAIESQSHATAFISLWALLECLTGASRERNADIVKRAAFVFGRERLAEASLRHLQHQRNQLVHHDAADADMFESAHLTKLFVDVLLLIHLGLGPRFGSMGEMGRFLELPPEPEALRERMQHTRLAMKFQQDSGPRS